MFWQNDKEFLRKLDLERNKTLYIKIVLLDFAENPIEEIQGRVSDGSLSLDGDSAIRRTCNLTLQVDKLNFDYSLWAVKSKFQLFIGLENSINSLYDSIVWFKQGVFVFTSFSPQLSTNGCSISISGKDKMCLLNGEMGGIIKDNSVDFSYIDEIDTEGNKTQTKQLIKDIIYNGLVNYANELPYKIFLNDLDDRALEVISYKGEENIYLLRKVNTNIIDQIVLENDRFWQDEMFVYDDLIETEIDKTPSLVVDDKYTVIKIEKNDIIGYRETDLTYTGELILNTGDAITSMLDKIKTMLGSYEYFYDIDGNFIFQKKKTYTDSKYSILKTDSVTGEIYADAAINNTEIAYKFLDTSLITSLSNTPNLANLKNDFSIWGSRKGASGAEIPIHLRYAFAKKPERYVDYQGEKEILATEYDWRELIYHMALDYYQYGQENDFLSTIAENNPEYPLGITGYESFYLELIADWRKMYLGTDKDTGKFKDTDFDLVYNEESKTYLWHKSVIDDPSSLDYWLDFLDDSDWDSGQYNIHTIGNRIVAINNSEITNIILPEIPMVIFYESGKQPNNTGYTLIQCPKNMWSAFEIAKVGYSAFEELDELLYKHTGFNDSINLSILPIYYLQPNTLIEISNSDINIFGKFIMNRISIPLKQGGTSSVNAIKANFRF